MSFVQPRNRIVRLNPYLKYPNLRALPVRLAVSALEGAIDGLKHGPSSIFTCEGLASRLDKASLYDFDHLTDDLVPYFRLSDDGACEKIRARSAIELEAFQSNADWPSSSMQFTEFGDRLRAIHHAATGRKPELRRGAMRTRPDAGNNTIIFPPSDMIEDLLEELHGRLVNLSAYPTTTAIVAYVGLIHCHPFADGNGRTARVLFNLMLSRAAGSPVFIPLAYWSHLCCGSFVLKVRRAMYGGDWPPLLLFLRDTLTVLVTPGGSTRPSNIDSHLMSERRVL